MTEPFGGRVVGGLPLLTGGFRPFFLLAALWAAFVIPVWLGLLAGHVAVPTAMAPLVWHVHETVFGFGVAVVAGFLLTAVPNWTGRLPLRGGPLLALSCPGSGAGAGVSSSKVWTFDRLRLRCSSK